LTTAEPASFESSIPYRTTRDGSRRYSTSRRALDAVTFGLCGTTSTTRSAAKSRTRCTAPISAPLALQTPDNAESRCPRTGSDLRLQMVAGHDLNLRPSGYEPTQCRDLSSRSLLCSTNDEAIRDELVTSTPFLSRPVRRGTAPFTAARAMQVDIVQGRLRRAYLRIYENALA
jgi:hypothetical protein